MEIKQIEFNLKARPRGFHIITDEVLFHLGSLPEKGLLHLLIKHTSAGLTLGENADPDVRTDLEEIFDRLVKEREPYYIHTYEGPDDMPSHAKNILTGAGLTVPVTDRRLNLGTWQGIYLCEFRNHGGPRKVVATIIG
ncbi:MAG: secondary thiamine-phosphate synthase enzyme YjbQ [Alistipes sp.]|nr:secondary thiamine-phosphate synthase enzyme YjbQ [Alistipes sp.]